MKSEEVINRAMKIMPGGVSSPVRALKGVNAKPLFVNRGQGARVWDLDEKNYIDLCMSFGPLILGHANPHVIKSVQEAAANGTSFGISTQHEVDLAERIVHAHPGVQWVRFVNSGTEAVMSAIRVARGVTGRDLIIKFKGCYHGHVDSMLVKSGSGLATFGLSSSKGVPADVSKNTIVLELGDLEQVKIAFEKYPDQIAALIVEGIPANNGLLIQSREYMQGLQEIAQGNGALFILDEVITGFRLGLGGATEYYGLEPDLVTMGKVIGGGLPVGLYGGKMTYMSHVAPVGGVYQAGTLSGNPLAMTAGNATLDVLEKEPVYQRLEQLGNSIEHQLKELFADVGKPLSIQRAGSIFWMILEDDVAPVRPDQVTDTMVDHYKNLFHGALDNGVYLPPSAYEVAFLSLAHVEEEEELIKRIRRAIE